MKTTSKDQAQAAAWGVTRRQVLGGIATAGGWLAASHAWAQDFPQRPVTLVVPYPPGGAGDIIGRTLSEKLAQRWAQPVIVQNKVGAGGLIGVTSVTRAAPDGYTIVLTTADVTLILAQQDKPQLDLFRDLEPVGLVATFPMVLLANKDLPASSPRQLFELARTTPGGLFYGGNGQVGIGNLAIELLKARNGANLTYVPYQGGAASIAAVLGNQIPLAIIGVGNVLPLLKAGSLKPILVVSSQRSSLIPDVPALGELGIDGIDIQASLGWAAPKNTPQDITNAISVAVRDVLALPETRDKFKTMGLEPVGSTPQAYTRFLRRENEQFRAGIRSTGLRGGT